MSTQLKIQCPNCKSCQILFDNLCHNCGHKFNLVVVSVPNDKKDIWLENLNKVDMK